MTSTIERAVESLSIAMSTVGEVSSSLLMAEQITTAEKIHVIYNVGVLTSQLSFVKHILELQQGALIAYAECIREKRRNSRHKRKRKNSNVNNFIVNSIV